MTLQIFRNIILIVVSTLLVVACEPTPTLTPTPEPTESPLPTPTLESPLPTPRGNTSYAVVVPLWGVAGCGVLAIVVFAISVSIAAWALRLYKGRF